MKSFLSLEGSAVLRVYFYCHVLFVSELLVFGPGANLRFVGVVVQLNLRPINLIFIPSERSVYD
jgi:hypothetical protein